MDCKELHNDSTSVTFSGAYRSATGATRAGKPTAPIAFGHNKDHRADLKQLVWILTVTADGAVPVAYRVEGGATNDDTTHIPTWDALVDLLGRTDFLYVADTKLANREAMTHIAAAGGRFVTVLPRTRKEDGFFRAWVQDHSPIWTEAARRPSRRPGEPDNLWATTPSPVPSAEGYRIVWVHSTLEAALDADSRQSRIQRAVTSLSDLATRVSSPKSRWHTRAAVEAAAQRELASSNASRWVSVEVDEHEEESFSQERRGRPGEATRYRRTTRTRFTLHWKVDTDLVAYDAASDGCFPLVTNDTAMSDAEVLAAYKYQPHLERRHAQLKGVQLVAPVFLKDVARIEGLLCCHFVALLVQALVERQIRRAMAATGVASIPLYPEDRECGAPSAPRIFEVFTGLARHELIRDGGVVQTFAPELMWAWRAPCRRSSAKRSSALRSLRPDRRSRATSRSGFRKKSPLDVGELDVVIMVRTKLFEHRVQDKQRRADLICGGLASLCLGQIGVWLILCEGAWTQS